MNENVGKKSSLELTKKGKIIMGILVVAIIAVIITVVVMNKNKGENKKLLEEATLSITLTPDKNSGSSMILSPGNETTTGISVGSTATLTYTFDKDIDEDVNWVLSDTSIAKVEDNVLTGLEAGTVEIYAVAKNNNNIKSNTVTLNVSK